MATEGNASGFHTDPDTWDKPRLYHTSITDDYADRVVVSKSTFPAALLQPIHSDNEAYYFMVMGPDFSEEGPWTTTIYLYNEREKLTRIELEDHAAYPVKVQWTNEKLIFVRVWWGRAVGTDLLFDVESEEIIFSEIVRDGNVPFQQSRQSKWSGDDEHEFLEFYQGDVSLPARLLDVYARLIEAFERGDSGDITVLSLPSAIDFTYDPRPDDSHGYGEDLNIPFVLNEFDPYIRNISSDVTGSYLIRTGTTAMWFVKTHDSGWMLYRYLDKPIQ
jgi:hypothetical protein